MTQQDTHHETGNPGAAINPVDPAFIACPFPAYEQLRAEAPVVFVPHGKGFWFVARHDLVKQVVGDTATFSSQVGSLATARFTPELLEQMMAIAATGVPQVPTLLTADPPVHTRNRRLVSRAFTPRAVKAYEPMVREICRDLIASWGGQDSVDFVRTYSVPVPVRVIAAALAVPGDHEDDFKRWSDASVALIGSKLPDDEVLAATQGVADMSLFLLAEIEARRAAGPGAEDILSTLVHARLTDDETADLAEGAQRQLTDAEIISIVRQLLVAGNETTTNLLTQMMVRFAEQPEWWQRLRAEPELIPAVIEENLRLISPSGVNQRRTTRDVELGGQVIPAGSDVLVIYLSANHDEQVFPDPEVFDPERSNLGEHLAFGRGIHFCVGASLARLEARIALEELVHGVERFELVRPDERDWNESFMLRAIRTLPIRATLAS